MFHRYEKKVKLAHTKALKDLVRIVPASILLSEEKRGTLLKQIKEASALEEARFDSLCLSLIYGLTTYSQSLPETSTSYYSHPGGLLEFALNRTEAALNLFRQYLLLEEGRTDLSEEQMLWQYVLFSAALLQGIGKLQIDYNVGLYDHNGQFLKQWNPLLENLVALGSHYGYEFQKESSEELRRRLNLLLARQIMPASGFSWIAANPQALAVWLALLNEDMDGAGTLGAILVRAKAIAIQRYFNQLILHGYGGRGGRYGRVSTFAGGGQPESLSDMEQQLGIEFIQWLTKALEAGRIMINKAPLFMVPGGMLMSVDMFKLFVRENPEYKNWQAIQNGFLSLGLHHVGADGNTNLRFEQNSTQQIHEGIVFADYAVALPNEVQLRNLHSGKAMTLSATELINHAHYGSSFFTGQHPSYSVTSLAHLNAKGQWQVEHSPALNDFLRPGAMNGG